MKNKFLLILTLPLFFACNNASEVKTEASEEIVTSQVPGNYGAIIEESEVLSISQMYNELASKGEFEGRVVGQIKEVCTKKGCWMTLDLPNGESMRVTFKDYGFFVPKDIAGQKVIFEGIAKQKVVSVSDQKHYAEDAGVSRAEIDKIDSEKVELTFVADGVLVPKK